MNTLLKHIAAGAVAGVAGTAAMNGYWKAATRLAGRDPRTLTVEGSHRFEEIDVAGRQTEEGESSTAATGRKVYEAATGRRPDEATREELSYGVHWSYGVAMGGLYGALRAGRGGSDAVGGLLFGAALWLVGDELLVPVLGLSKGPSAYPPEQHAHRLGAHLVYGAATALTTQALVGTASRAARPKPTLLRLGLKTGRTYLKWQALAKSAKLVTRKLGG